MNDWGTNRYIASLVNALIVSESPAEKLEYAEQISEVESPANGRGIQAINRAIFHFRDSYPDAYNRAKDTTRVCRSIPPSTKDGGTLAYLRLEEACATLLNTRRIWEDALRAEREGTPKITKRIEREEHARALNAMRAIGRKRKKVPPASPEHSRKPKRRLHS